MTPGEALQNRNEFMKLIDYIKYELANCPAVWQKNQQNVHTCFHDCLGYSVSVVTSPESVKTLKVLAVKI